MHHVITSSAGFSVTRPIAQGRRRRSQEHNSSSSRVFCSPNLFKMKEILLVNKISSLQSKRSSVLPRKNFNQYLQSRPRAYLSRSGLAWRIRCATRKKCHTNSAKFATQKAAPISNSLSVLSSRLVANVVFQKFCRLYGVPINACETDLKILRYVIGDN